MSSNKIYPLFLEKIECQYKNQIYNLINKNPSDKGQFYRIIISFEDKTSRDKFLLQNSNLKILNKFDFIPAINLYLSYKEILDLEKESLIKKIEEDQRLYLSMLETIYKLELINYRKSQIVFKGKNVRIGIIDNGINRNIDSIWDIIKEQYSLTKENGSSEIKENNNIIKHGTLMANIIGNQYIDYYDNIVGIAPNAEILDFDATINSDDNFYFSNILRLFDIIDKKKINVSMLLISFTTLEPSDGKDILSLACNQFVDRGIIIICPAGNFGPEKYTIGSPGSAEKVITIGSLTKEGKIAYYSGRGPTLDGRNKPDFYLPGSKIEIALTNNSRVIFSGTSVAAAIGTGLIALLKEFNPKITYTEILEIIKKASIYLNFFHDSDKYVTTNIIKVFEVLGLYQECILPYNFLIKRALKTSIYMIIFFISSFFIWLFLGINKFLIS
ncbi:MAG: S8 family serine peptidase [Promethearchaeota archaeon]